MVLKPSLFQRMIGFLKGLFVREEHVEQPETVKRFDQYLTHLEKNDPMYEKCVQSASLCDEALRIAKQRMILASRMKLIDEKLLELECFSQLSDEQAKRLENLLTHFVSLTRERNTLIYQLTDFDKNLTRMSKLEKEAAGAIAPMADAERSQQVLKQDIGLLEGEKAALEYEHGFLQNALKFIQYFTVAAVGLFGFGAVFLAYLFMFKNVSIFLPTTILVLLTIGVITLLFFFKKRMRYELKVNVKKQQRAVELLNKKNVVYAYYTNFLRFEYGKYKVRNAMSLQESLKDFKHYKHITARIDAIRKIMYETEAAIERFLRENNFSYSKFSIEEFARTIDVADKIEYNKELLQDKELIEKNLKELDDMHAEVWDLLESVAQQDYSEDKIIGQMVQAYFDEVSQMLFIIDKPEEAV